MAIDRQRPIGYSPKFGITFEHWKVFQQYTMLEKYVTIVRCGKENAIHWIKKSYPAKPVGVNAKVDVVIPHIQ